VICHTAGIRTTLDIDDALLEALRERLPDRSKTEAIEEAIRAFVRADAARELRALAGSIDVDDVSGELRGADRRS
jgi:Arc/MetJ family transcription regulator